MQDVQSSKTTFINKTQQCFAVRSGVDGILDLARSTFCRVTEQVHELVDKYKIEHEFEALKVNCLSQHCTPASMLLAQSMTDFVCTLSSKR